MDARELKERLDSLQKAVAKNDAPATVITMLETLKSNVNATEDLLRVCCPFAAGTLVQHTDMNIDHESWCHHIET
jgi:hypothetical protein